MIGLEEKNSVLFQYTNKMTSDLLEEIKLLRDLSLKAEDYMSKFQV